MGLVSMMLLSSCQDMFLDLDPLDSLTEAAYYNKPEHFAAATNGLYDGLAGWAGDNQEFNMFDTGSDLMSGVTNGASNYTRGTITPRQSDAYWTNTYKQLREVNIIIKKVAEYGGDATEIAEYLAVAKFFRAYHHYRLLQRFGGVPIVTEVVDLSSGVLYGPRNSRYEVVAQIKVDLEAAIPDLRINQNIADNDQGKINRWAAEALLADAMLYEATWEKYVGETTDGDGIASGAGAAKPANYPSAEAMLTIAADRAKSVMDHGGYALFDYRSNADIDYRSMYYLFNLEDAESNPAGLTKSDNHEFILYSKYDYSLRRSGEQISLTVKNYGAPSRKMMDMVLCDDGLPVDKSNRFKGYENTEDEYTNRDDRFTAYFLQNIDNIETTTPDKIPVNGDVKLTGVGVGAGSGYSNRKFATRHYGVYRAAREESQDYPIIRLAEVYLIYAEALYEKNGAITDEQLNESINKIRARAGITNALTNSFAAANDLDILEEIRRERAVELYMEDSRFHDLKRWGMAEEALSATVFGSVVEGTHYETADFNEADYIYGIGKTETGEGSLNAVIMDPAANRNFTRKNYLFPIPLEQIQINNALKQNLGY